MHNLDPDPPTKALPFLGHILHYMVANIPGSDMNSGGETIVEYTPPNPPICMELLHYFVLNKILTKFVKCGFKCPELIVSFTSCTSNLTLKCISIRETSPSDPDTVDYDSKLKNLRTNTIWEMPLLPISLKLNTNEIHDNIVITVD